jgi:hypothetical protein
MRSPGIRLHGKAVVYANLCIRAKLRESPKTLVTKEVRETLPPAWLMSQDMVTSLEMKETEMGNRGSKSDNDNYL